MVVSLFVIPVVEDVDAVMPVVAVVPFCAIFPAYNCPVDIFIIESGSYNGGNVDIGVHPRRSSN